MKNLLFLLFVLTSAIYAADNEDVEGCAADEYSIFYGETAGGKSLVVVSAPKTPDDRGDYLSFYYRRADGTKDKLKIFNDAENPARARIDGLSGEQIAYVRFPSQDTEYVVYAGEDPFAWVDDAPPAYAGLVELKNGAVVERLVFTECDFDFKAETLDKVGLAIDDEMSEAAANPRDKERVKNSFDWRVRTAFPATGVAAVDEQTRAFIKDFLARQIAASSTGEVFAPYNADLTVAGKLTRPSDRAVSVVLLMNNYEQSAAHPSHLTRVLNYELSGAALSRAKIFGKPEKALSIFAARAPALAFEQLKIISAENSESALTKQDENDLRKMLAGFQDGFAATADNYAEIGLEPTGVRLYFQEYQIAPYSFGMPTVLIPLADLADAEPNLALWGK